MTVGPLRNVESDELRAVRQARTTQRLMSGSAQARRDAEMALVTTGRKEAQRIMERPPEPALVQLWGLAMFVVDELNPTEVDNWLRISQRLHERKAAGLDFIGLLQDYAAETDNMRSSKLEVVSATLEGLPTALIPSRAPGSAPILAWCAVLFSSCSSGLHWLLLQAANDQRAVEAGACSRRAPAGLDARGRRAAAANMHSRRRC